eukprot:SAG31_NODE_1655_length_7621_cov_3.211912_7_plen_180_part_00
MQLTGSKLWTVHETAVPFARSEEATLQSAALAAYAPVAEYRLLPGDLLYIPRGTPHSAVNLVSPKSKSDSNGSASSTHLTVGLHIYLWQTFEGFLHRAAAHWLASVALRRDRRLRLVMEKLEEWLPAGVFAQVRWLQLSSLATIVSFASFLSQRHAEIGLRPLRDDCSLKQIVKAWVKM